MLSFMSKDIAKDKAMVKDLKKGKISPETANKKEKSEKGIKLPKGGKNGK